MNLVLVWMIFEHMNSGLHGSLHRRGEYNLPIDGVDDLVVRLTLFDATSMELWVNEIFACFDSPVLRRGSSKVSLGNQSLVVEL